MTWKAEWFTYRSATNEEPARDKIEKLLQVWYIVTWVYPSSQEDLYTAHLDRLLLTSDVVFTVIIDSDLEWRHQAWRRELYTYYKILEKKVDVLWRLIGNTSQAVKDTI